MAPSLLFENVVWNFHVLLIVVRVAFTFIKCLLVNCSSSWEFSVPVLWFLRFPMNPSKVDDILEWHARHKPGVKRQPLFQQHLQEGKWNYNTWQWERLRPVKATIYRDHCVTMGGLPCWLRHKEPPCQCGRCNRPGFHPWVQSLGQEDPLEEKMASHSSILAWKILWTAEPGGLQSVGSQRVGYDSD